MINHKKDQTANNERLGTILSQNLQKNRKDECPAPEVIATLIEGNLSASERDQVQKHLAACKKCFDTFILSSDLKYSSPKKTAIPYRPLALAASIFILILSLFILYKSGFINIKSGQLLEVREPEIRAIQPHDVDYLRKKDASTEEYMKKGDRAKIPVEPERKKEKREISDENRAKSFSGLKKGYDTGDLKSKLPGTQSQMEVPYPQSPKKESKAKRAAMETRPRTQQKRIKPLESETIKNQKVQTKTEQTEGNIQEFKIREKTESDITVESSRVVSFHANGNKKLVNNYIQVSGKRILKDVVEYNPEGQIISIQNPNTQVMKKFGYFPNGNKKFREEYKNGIPHGNWVSWNQKGEIIASRIYKKGKLEKEIK